MPKYYSTEGFYEDQNDGLQELLYLIRETIISADTRLKESVKYNTVFFERLSWVCYIGNIHPKTGIEIVFARGYAIENEHGLLDQKNRKAMLGITFSDLTDFIEKEPVFIQILQEALLLDDISTHSAPGDILSGRYKQSKKN